MVHKNRINHSIVGSLLFPILAKIAACFKVTVVVGSFTALFSAANMVAPLSGAYGGLAGSCALLAFGVLTRMMLGMGVPYYFLAYHIPGFFASLYWSAPNVFIRLVVPLLCMALFIIHPVGAQAFPYALYWLVPVMLYFVNKKNLFLQALGSTFTAHAVGSVIWLYTVSMAPTVWIGLIPVVAAERLLFAAGMVIMHHIIGYCINVARNMQFVKQFVKKTCVHNA